MSSDEVRDVIATLREVPRYVVRNDALTSRAVVGFDKWKGTTDVVLYADHVAALLTQDQQHGEQSHAHYMDGYAAALSAARDAVVAVRPAERWGSPTTTTVGGFHIHQNAALAAIDALAAGQAPAPTNDGDN